MICPFCNSLLSGLTSSCPACGREFDVSLRRFLSRHAAVVDEVQRLSSAMGKLQSAMGRLGNHVNELGRMLPVSAAPGPVQSQEPDFLLEPVAPTAPSRESITPSTVPVQFAPEKPASRPGNRHDISGNLSELALGQKWLLVLGIVATVFGMGYFLKYSFDQGWVGPAGRVASAHLTGLGLLAAGELFRRRGYGRYGLFLMGGGIAVLYFAAFAGFQFYHLLDQIPSFGLMVLTTALAVTLALVHDARGLAVIGLVGGFLTPAVLSTGQDNHMVLFSYMTLLNLGLLWTALHKRWDVLHWLGFGATYLLFGSWHDRHFRPEVFWPALLFVNVFFLIYTVAPFAAHLARNVEGRFATSRLTVLNSFVAFGFTFAMVRDRFPIEWAGLASLAYALVFLGLATIHHRRLGEAHPGLKMLLANAALFIALSVPIVLSGHWITTFWAVLAAVTLWLAHATRSRSLAMGAWLLAGLTLLKLLGYDYPDLFGVHLDGFRFSRGWFHHLPARLTASATVLASLGAMAEISRRRPDPELALVPDAPGRPPRDWAVLYGVFGCVLFLLAHLEVNGLFTAVLPGARFAAVTALWTFFAATLMVLGFRNRIPRLRWVSLALFGATILKVFTLDIARFATPYRILSFIVLGVILVACSFLYYRFRDRITVLSGEPPQGDPS